MKALLIGLLFFCCLSAGAQPNLTAASSIAKATETLSKINSGAEITTKKTNPVSLFAKTNPLQSSTQMSPAPERK
ncbi:hypothetical protein DOM22_08190 [Bdellovibrio sp. ZAP7]|uniref:hypothetical protein n=1 Tax=Bdellovibrio sp. ZAP7 TaxID=2231053 RepID=UPI0011576C24|nr:hypothetical protein [Bdellovibrio sp. ZAP7]QDK45137.1 hypothetical protein DOM22_08190 [Bdellovibrio sp. ZAP7]